MTLKITITQADYNNPKHQQHIPMLLNQYASDPMGGAKPLTADVMQNLVPELAKRLFAFSVLAYVEENSELKPAGLINCFEGFSTFAARPLIRVCLEFRFAGKNEIDCFQTRRTL